MKNTKAVTYVILCLFSISLIFLTVLQEQDVLANNLPREASPPNNCAKGLVPIIKKRSSKLICVKPATATKLIARDWGARPEANTAASDETSPRTTIEAITKTNTVTGTDIATRTSIITGVDAITKTATITSTPEIIVTHKYDITSARCEPEEIAKIITSFLDAFNQGDRDALARFFGENFQMYTVSEHNRQTGQFRPDVYYGRTSHQLRRGSPPPAP